LNRPFPPRSSSAGSITRINGKIRAREVRVIGVDGQQVGVLQLGEAINLARSHGVDLVEIAPNATPPVCRLVDYGKFRYEQSKKDKESRKHHHANKVKEIQLSATIDPHDFSVKLSHAIDFLCEEMKVKAALRFRGREMAHQEFGFQVVERFIKALEPYGHPDAPPKLVGRSINLMFSPLPRSKRAKHPNQGGDAAFRPGGADSTDQADQADQPTSGEVAPIRILRPDAAVDPAAKPSPGFTNNPFSGLDEKLGSG
jgi:translation initiation factor IF-3